MYKLHGKPWAAEIQLVLNANVGGINLYPLRVRFIISIKQMVLFERGVIVAADSLLDATGFFLIELTKIGNDTLTWPSIGTIGLD